MRFKYKNVHCSFTRYSDVEYFSLDVTNLYQWNYSCDPHVLLITIRKIRGAPRITLRPGYTSCQHMTLSIELRPVQMNFPADGENGLIGEKITRHICHEFLCPSHEECKIELFVMIWTWMTFSGQRRWGTNEEWVKLLRFSHEGHIILPIFYFVTTDARVDGENDRWWEFLVSFTFRRKSQGQWI